MSNFLLYFFNDSKLDKAMSNFLLYFYNDLKLDIAMSNNFPVF